MTHLRSIHTMDVHLSPRPGLLATSERVRFSVQLHEAPAAPGIETSPITWEGEMTPGTPIAFFEGFRALLREHGAAFAPDASLNIIAARTGPLARAVPKRAASRLKGQLARIIDKHRLVAA